MSVTENRPRLYRIKFTSNDLHEMKWAGDKVAKMEAQGWELIDADYGYYTSVITLQKREVL
jgi:hypothetical protein